MPQLPCVGRWGLFARLPTVLEAPLICAFLIRLTMTNDEIKKQILDAITSGKIQATTINFGDHVEHQHRIDKVEAGGIGFQIIESAASSLPRPKEGRYNEVREYIEKRKEQDEVFKQFCLSHSRKQLCEFLSMEFGWHVDDHHLGVNIGRNQ